MSPDTLTRANFALDYQVGPPDERGNPFYNVGYAAVPGADEIIVLSLSKAASSTNGGLELVATGFSVGGQSGAVNFRTVLADVNEASQPGGIFAPSITVLANGTVAVAWQVALANQAGDARDDYALLSASGDSLASGPVFKGRIGRADFNYEGPPDIYWTASGFNIEFNTRSAAPASGAGDPQQFAYVTQSFDLAGAHGTWRASGANGPIGFVPHAWAAAPPVDLQIVDNMALVYEEGTLARTAAIPGEPAHAITSETATLLANGHAAVAWVDSGSAYVSLLDPSTGVFSHTTGLNWGEVQDVHLVALPDGGFVASWMNFLPPFGSPMTVRPPHYQGEVFTADGIGGGVMTLAGNVGGIDSHGDLYTVDLDSRIFVAGSENITTYAINGGGSPGGPGQVFTSDNSGDHWTGTAGDDTFNFGRGGDVVAGNGGNDTFRFAEVPWTGGHITDFKAGDTLDLSGLMSTTADTGMDGFADGYLRIGDDGSGNAQVWARYETSGSNSQWWLIETLDGVAPANLHQSGESLTAVSSITGPITVTTSDTAYIAATSVRTITLSGSDQQVDAFATLGVTIDSNDSGNRLIGGRGDDLFHLGRGGDVVTGNGGADTFAYRDIPWAGGSITDFSAGEGDRLDVSGLLASAHYTGSDPFADGVLKYGSDGAGDAQLWANYGLPGNDGWWLVTTLQGVPLSWVQSWHDVLIT